MSSDMKRGSSAANSQPGEILLSSDEQDAIVRSLQEDLRKQSRCIRVSISIIFGAVATIFAYCAVLSFANPWNLIHQQRFEYTIPYVCFQLFYAVSVLNFSVATIICLVRVI